MRPIGVLGTCKVRNSFWVLFIDDWFVFRFIELVQKQFYVTH